MQIDEERRAIGREIKRYLAVNRISREEFCFQTKLGKSTVDKLITGIYSDTTLQIVLERTGFVRNNAFAAKNLGGYSRAAWSGYLSDYLFLLPSITGSGLEALRVAIEWDENLPGLAVTQKSGKNLSHRERIGIISIPHERSPLIYVQAVEGVGRTLIVSTMLGEQLMRGLMLTVRNLVANAYAPIALPVVLRRLGDAGIDRDDFGHIEPDHRQFPAYSTELAKVIDRGYGTFLGCGTPDPKTKKRTGARK
jgi:hypothetical protein